MALIKSQYRVRNNIFSDTAGVMTKIEKNSTDDIIRATDYDAQVKLKGDASATQDYIIVSPEEESNLGMYQKGDLIAVRNESSAEPLGATKEEFSHVNAILWGDSEVTIQLTNNLSNSYPRATSYLYNCIQKEQYRAGYDKTVTTIEMWKNN